MIDDGEIRMQQLALWSKKPTTIESPSCVTDLLLAAPKNGEIHSTICKCYDHIQNHKKIMCSISGGYDSDILMDLMIRCGGKEKSTFVFNNTGLEYDATKEHISYLEELYGVNIIKLRPQKAIQTCCREYGVPFWSKHASEMIYRLQRHGFQWEDEPLDVLMEKYRGCKSALRWWANDYETKVGNPSKFNINWVEGLKEFLMNSPPNFKISQKCCLYAKKNPIKEFLDSGFDLNCMGVRKAEGGQRSTKYKSCFDQVLWGPDNYRPLFWWSDQDKEMYRNHYGIIRSDCYEMWGMVRTGCAGCPFGKNFEEELDLVRLFEPKRYRAILSVFGQSYDYTRRFLEFREKLKIVQKSKGKSQTRIEGV